MTTHNMAIDLKTLTIKKAHTAMQSGEYTCHDLVQTYLDEIKKRNPEINAYLTIFDDAVEQADLVDNKIKAGEEIGLLEGIPMAIKDLILIDGKRATGASKILENYVATYDATVIKKLKEAGVIFLGKTNTDEFAMGGSTENSAFGVTKNPHDLERVAGGSSGGSTAAVAGKMALAALGSDTGGSIREPSSFCGTVGLKPTYGAVSRFGAMAMTSSLEQIAPVAGNVEDVEIVFKAIRGQDSLDATSTDGEKFDPIPTDYKFKIGVPRSFVSAGLKPEVEKNFNDSIEKLKDLGCEIVDIELPMLKYSLACYYITVFAEVSANMARLDGMRYGLHIDGASGIDDYFKSRGAGFGPEVRRRIMLGTYVLSAGYYDAYYSKATKVRKAIREDYLRAFKDVDVILTPTAPSPAFKIGEKVSDPLQMYLEDIFTVPINLAGLPALAIPSGETESGLPLGIQFTASHWREDKLIALGKKFEEK
ncbi:MAG: Asp-tRNA(Asn)/Glu-tRNA(Gln) amidotransferase subunit GatA [bacterium]